MHIYKHIAPYGFQIISDDHSSAYAERRRDMRCALRHGEVRTCPNHRCEYAELESGVCLYNEMCEDIIETEEDNEN